MSDQLDEHPGVAHSAAEALFAGPGEMRARCRALDWATTPLGLVEVWSAALRFAVHLCLDSGQPMCVFGGPELVMIYNDAYAAAVGPLRLRSALGCRAREVWGDMWEEIGTEYATVMAGGPAVERTDVCFRIDGGHGIEDEYWSWVTSPIRDDDGHVVGCHTVVHQATDRVRGELSLRESEAKFRTLFERMSQGYCELELVRDASGRAVDQRYLMFNPALERLFGISAADATGRTASDVFPDLEPWWTEAFDRIARQGTPERIEHRFAALNRWFDVSVYPTGGDRLTVMYDDVTERRRAADALREREERQAFLLKVSDALRPLADPMATIATVSEMVGRYLDAGRCGYGELPPPYDHFVVERDWTNGMPSHRGRWRLADFGDELVSENRAGHTLVIDDALADERSEGVKDALHAAGGLRASIGVPLVKDEKWVAAFFVHDSKPRQWTKGDLELVEEIAERTWAAVERARAEATLRESQERQAFQLRLTDALRPLSDPIAIVTTASEMLGRHLGVGRCGYGEVDKTDEYFIVERDWTDGAMPSFRGNHLLVSFGPEFTAAYRAGRSVRIDDALADARAGGAEAAFEAAGGVRASLGIPLIKDGRFVAGLFVQQMQPRHWTERDEALALDVVERTWAAVERARAEAALRESEEKYRTTLDSMEEAYCIIEMIFDESGVAVDFRYLETNRAFVRHATMPMLGRRIKEIVPNVEPFWLEQYGHVAKTGEPVHLENVVEGLGNQWFETSAFRLGGPGSDRVVVFFANITARKRAEEALRESESRQIFLLTLSDALRSVADPHAIQQTALRIVAEHLHVDRVMFTEITSDDTWINITSSYSREAFPQLTGRLPASGFGEALALLHTGNLFVVADVETEPTLSESEKTNIRALGVGAVAAIPFTRGGRWVASLVAHHGVPRAWTPDDIALIEEAAERIWAAVERARAESALRESEARYRALIDNVYDYAIFLLDMDGRVTEWTPGAQHVKGYTAREVLGRHIGMFYPDNDRAGGVPEHELAVAAERGRLESEGWRVRKNGERFWADEIVTPIHDASGTIIGFTKICRDLTHRMLVEAAAERQRQDREREEFRRQLAAVEEGERRRLARELHDQLGQHLAALSLGLDEARRLVTDGGGRSTLRVGIRLQALQELATAMTTDARNLALELRPPELDDVGLDSALETYVTRWSARAHIHADVETAGLAAASLAPAVATAIYRIVQEALTNTLKHAVAQHVSVIVEHADGNVRLIIEDDGHGFDTDVLVTRAPAGLGLAGMRERAALAGGVLTIESTPGSGTTIYVTFPTDGVVGAQRLERESVSTPELSI